jgi:hypothetical protein
MGSAPLVLDSRDVDDRAVDLWAPLPALAMVADVEAGGDRAERLLRAARELGEAREADDESGQAARSSDRGQIPQRRMRPLAIVDPVDEDVDRAPRLVGIAVGPPVDLLLP